MKVSTIRWMAALTMVAAAAVSLAEPTLKVGSKAPELKVAKWIKGAPVKSFEDGKVYVVEFWATWCGPCKVSIPHLTELAKKYKDKATFTGVSVFEEQDPQDEAYIAKVEKFVTEWGDKMDYNVAVDGKDGWMGANWMEAAEQPGIPTAFIVDQKGNVAWIGHPMANLDEVLGKVIAGTFDVKAEAARVAKEKAAEEAMMAEVRGFMDPLQKGDNATALVEMDKAFAKNPKLEQQFGMAKFQVLAQTDERAATAYATKLAEGVYKEDSNALNSIAWAMVDDETVFAKPDYKVAVKIAEQGVAMLKEGMDTESAFILDTLAYAYFKDGQIDKAISTQEKSLAAANRAKDFDPETMAEIKARLEVFKKKKG